MVTLNQPPEGNTDWADDVNTNWVRLQNEVIDKTTVDATGDLLAATDADVIARLPVGTNGQILTADSGETTGIKWADNAGVSADKVLKAMRFA